MLRRSGTGTAALLNKVSSQLKGEKVKVEEEDEGLGAYLSSLTKKPANNQPKWDKFGEEDLSISSEDGKKSTPRSPAPKVNKFLKKKPAESQSAPPTAGKRKENNKMAPTATSKSSALDRASAFDNKYKAPPRAEVIKFSDSELDDMSGMSFDDDIMQSLQPAKAPAPQSSAAAARKAPAPQSSAAARKAPAPQSSAAASTKPTKTKPQKAKSPDLSDDSDFGRGNASKFMKKKKPEPEKPKPQAQKKKQPVFTNANLDSDEDSMSFGGGGRFMKKKPAKKDNVGIEEKIELTEERESKPVEITPKVSPVKKDMFSLRSSEKYGTQVELDSDEESMQNFIKGLSPQQSPARSPSPPASPSRTQKGILKTPRTPRTPTMEYISEEDESNVPSLDEDLHSDNDSFKQSSSLSSVVSSIQEVNLMDIDALELAAIDEPAPSKPPSGKKQKHKLEKKPSVSSSKSSSKRDQSSDLFASLGLHSVDELLAPDLEFEPASESEVIRTEQYDSDFEPVSKSERPTTPLRSILSPSPRPLTPRSSRSRVRLSLSNVHEVRSPRSPSPEVIMTGRTRSASIAYSEDFDDDSVRTDTIHTQGSDTEDSDRTLSPVPSRRRHSSYDEYSEDFTSAASSPRRGGGSRFSRMSSRDSTYSTFSDTYSERSSRSPSPEPAPRPSRSKGAKMKSTQVQTGLDLGDLVYQWSSTSASVQLNYPLGASTDPTMVSSHVVGADSLESMTAFSPSVLALNDLLRSHLEMTRNFLESQKRLHETLASTMYPDYKYTTLEDTHKYIKENKRKTLTFDQALRQVKKEMGLKK